MSLGLGSVWVCGSEFGVTGSWVGVSHWVRAWFQSLGQADRQLVDFQSSRWNCFFCIVKSSVFFSSHKSWCCGDLIMGFRSFAREVSPTRGHLKPTPSSDWWDLYYTKRGHETSVEAFACNHHEVAPPFQEFQHVILLVHLKWGKNLAKGISVSFSVILFLRSGDQAGIYI